MACYPHRWPTARVPSVVATSLHFEIKSVWSLLDRREFVLGLLFCFNYFLIYCVLLYYCDLQVSLACLQDAWSACHSLRLAVLAAAVLAGNFHDPSPVCHVLILSWGIGRYE